jgi:hypothetical protein
MDRSNFDELRAGLIADHVDGDPDTDKGIDAGRNVRAGYSRGVGLEFGKLHDLVNADPDWQAAYEVARERSIVSPYRLMNLYLILKYSPIRTGNIIEFGSYRGGSALLLAILAKRLRSNCKVYALDTFTGMPETDANLDRHRSGGFSNTSFEELEQLKSQLGLDNLIILKGLFQDTVEQIPIADRALFLTHVDCDIYASVRFSIRYAKRYGVAGSYIVFDDPLTADCLGSMKAMEEDLIQKGCHSEQVFPHFVFRYPPLQEPLNP